MRGLGELGREQLIVGKAASPWPHTMAATWVSNSGPGTWFMRREKKILRSWRAA